MSNSLENNDKPNVIDKDGWQAIRKSLENLHTPVELRCDGYKITLVLTRLSQFSNGIVVYVNNKINIKWLTNDCEERRRFYRPIQRSLYTPKQKKALGKVSKRMRKLSGIPDPDAKFTSYRHYWTSFNSLKNHLIKNNSVIELIKA